MGRNVQKAAAGENSESGNIQYYHDKEEGTLMAVSEMVSWDINKEMYRYIVNYIKEHYYPPSAKEIADGIGVTKSTVRRHISTMIEDGLLESDCEQRECRAYRIKGTKVVRMKEKR